LLKYGHLPVFQYMPSTMNSPILHLQSLGMIFYYIPYLHNHGRLQHRVCQRRCWGSYAANPSSFSTFSIRMIEDGVLYPIFLPPQLCPRAWSFPNQRCNSRGRPSVTSASRVSFTWSPAPPMLFSCSQYPFRCRSILRVQSLSYASTALPLLTMAHLVQGSRPDVVAVLNPPFSRCTHTMISSPATTPDTHMVPVPPHLYSHAARVEHRQCRYPVSLPSASDLSYESRPHNLPPEAMPNFRTPSWVCCAVDVEATETCFQSGILA
jgi:hypothetical protein